MNIIVSSKTLIFFSRDEYFLTISDILTTVELVFCKYVYTFILQESYYYVQK